MKHKDLEGTDYPWMRAYAQVLFDERGADNWLLFEINHARKNEAPQDTVYCSIAGKPYSIMDKQFDHYRADMQAIIDKNGWVV